LLKAERAAKILQEAHELVARALTSRKTAKAGGLRQNNPPSLSIVKRLSAIDNFADSRKHP
jgi:hypothetical protein